MRTIITFLFAVAMLAGCKKNDHPAPKSSAKNINSFILSKGDNPSLDQDVIGRISQDTIYIEMKMGTNVVNLVPTISYAGASISPAQKTAQNFTNTVLYTVTADDGTTKTYRAIMRFLSGAKEITSFIFKKTNNPALTEDITGSISNDSISVVIPPGINLSSLVPTIIHTGIAISPLNEQAGDFTLPVHYEVKAEDGTIKPYTVFAGANSAVFLTGADGYLYAINGLNGSLRWKFFTGANAVPSFHNGVVFTAGANSVIYAVNAADGSLKWISDPPKGNYELTIPAIAGGKIYFAGNGYLNYPNSNYAYYAAFAYAVNEETGNQEWLSPLFTNYTYTTSWLTNITVKDNIACLYDLYHGLFVFNAIDGSALWATIGDMLGRGNPAISNNAVFYTMEGGIKAVDKNNGQLLWQFRNNLNFTSPTINNDVVYTAAASNLYAMDLAGNIKWQISSGNDAVNFYAPLTGNNSLYISKSNQQLSSYSTLDGSLNWTKDHFLAYPVLANNEIFICDNANQLNCLDASTGNVKWVSRVYNNFSKPFCVVDSKDSSYHVGDSGEQN